MSEEEGNKHLFVWPPGPPLLTEEKDHAVGYKITDTGSGITYEWDGNNWIVIAVPDAVDPSPIQVHWSSPESVIVASGTAVESDTTSTVDWFWVDRCKMYVLHAVLIEERDATDITTSVIQLYGRAVMEAMRQSVIEGYESATAK